MAFYGSIGLQSSLAQENEIERLAQTFDQVIVKKEKKSVLIGVSRGASTIINFMGLYNPEHVQAIILESPFDCVDSIARSICHESGAFLGSWYLAMGKPFNELYLL